MASHTVFAMPSPYFPIWTVFISSFGPFSFPHLAFVVWMSIGNQTGSGCPIDRTTPWMLRRRLGMFYIFICFK